jgi:hypothetical protein
MTNIAIWGVLLGPESPLSQINSKVYSEPNRVTFSIHMAKVAEVNLLPAALSPLVTYTFPYILAISPQR